MLLVRVPEVLSLALALSGCPSEGPTRSDASLADTPQPEATALGDGISDTAPGDGISDTAPGDGDETHAGACRSFDFSSPLEGNGTPGVYQLGGNRDLGLGGPLPDAVIFELYGAQTGTFDLGSGGNENYQTCSQCLRFVQDIDATGATQAKNFFQKGGVLTVAEATPPAATSLRITLQDVEMIEVTIRAADFLTTPVSGGSCYARPGELVLETGACVSACGAHACGPDGCGGECGAGCAGGDRCRLDGTSCEASPTCVPLSLTGTLENSAAGVYRLDVTSLGLSAVGQADFVQIELYQDATGTFDLASAVNRNYSTCKQCVRLVLDGRRELFQRQGQLVVGNASVPLGEPALDGFVDLRSSGIVLEEVVIDEEFSSMALPGGACVELLDGAIASPAH